MKQRTFEIGLYLTSISAIIIAYFAVGLDDVLNLMASLVGATMLIFIARGNILGPIFTVIFSILYAIISYEFKYYGEMITYIGMTGLISLITIFTWYKNPSKKNKNVVKINKLRLNEVLILFIVAIIITTAFYYILDILGTSNLIVSTLSVLTSFIACYFQMRRSPYYAVAYTLNDVVLIILWSLAMEENIEYLSMLICFIVFLVNDIYGFISWKMRERQDLASN